MQSISTGIPLTAMTHEEVARVARLGDEAALLELGRRAAENNPSLEDEDVVAERAHERFLEEDLPEEKADAYRDGLAEGREEGYDEGYCEGEKEGYDEGFADGYDQRAKEE